MEGFSNGLTACYHLIYGDRWDEAVPRQGASLARMICAECLEAVSVLDCACGIGTEAIGLAREGFRVLGTGLSAASIARARVVARRWDVAVDTAVADVRNLDRVGGSYDVALSADNALPHLLDDADLLQALAAIRTRLRPDGLLVVRLRDYDQALIDRPPTTVPTLITGPPRRVVVRLHDWDDAASPYYTVRFLLCTEDADGEWSVEHHQARHRAITRAGLTTLAEAVGFGVLTRRTAVVSSRSAGPVPLIEPRPAPLLSSTFAGLVGRVEMWHVR